MGELKEEYLAENIPDQQGDDDGYWQDEDEQDKNIVNIPSLEWEHGTGLGSWRGTAEGVQSRTAHLYNNNEMSDLCILAADENWWFGETVKDFTAHKFLLGTASPVFNRILFDWDEDTNNVDSEVSSSAGDRRLVLDARLGVTLTLSTAYYTPRLELDGIPPIATEALLQYIYKDKYNEEDFDHGYSRNLLWRLWHASRAFEMEHLTERCAKTLDRTMGEETVFWDLNYAMKYKALVSEDILKKVLKIVEEMGSNIFEHPNFVWLDFEAIHEILDKRIPASSDAVIILNNLLRWTLYQLDRSALIEIEIEDNEVGRRSVAGSQIPLEQRLDWLASARNGIFSDHVTQPDLDKYLHRGLAKMPWTEMSQAEFIQYAVSFPIGPPKLLSDDLMLKVSLELMDYVVRDSERLYRSAYKVLHTKGYNKPNNAEEIKASPKSKSNSSATERITALFSCRNGGQKCNTDTLEELSSPKHTLSRNSRTGSVKCTTPILKRKSAENTNLTIIQNDSSSQDDTNTSAIKPKFFDNSSTSSNMIILQ